MKDHSVKAYSVFQSFRVVFLSTIQVEYCIYHDIIFNHTRVIQKIRTQRCFRAQNVFKKSNLTHGKIQNHIFHQHVMLQLIWLNSLHYI